MKKNMKIVGVAAFAALVITGCGQPPQPPQPSEIVLPQPIMDNSGEYLFPYTQDEVLAEWTDKVIEAEGASSVGSAVGAYAGAKALEQVPFIGGWLGQKAGSAIGRKIVLESAGGIEFIKETSDISFNDPKDYCLYAYGKFSYNEHYQSAMKAAYSLYNDDINALKCYEYVQQSVKN